MEIAELKKKREAQINSIFILILEIAFIFAIPAVTATFLGKYLDSGEPKLYTVILLILAFISSWTMTIFLYKNKTRVLAKTEDLIKKIEK
jgi:protein-S-isoprenylcysteine O-methyltransferase Ste14